MSVARPELLGKVGILVLISLETSDLKINQVGKTFKKITMKIFAEFSKKR